MSEPIFTAQRTSSQIPERNERWTHSFFIRSAKKSEVRLFRVIARETNWTWKRIECK